MKRIKPPWAVLTAMTLAATATAAPPPTAVTITVDATPRQRFAGLGASLVADGRETPARVAKLTDFQRTLPARMLWGESGFTILRVWFDPREYAPEPGRHDSSAFVRRYVDTRRVADARAAGVTTLLLGPEAVPIYMSDGHGHFTDAGVKAYAELLADFLKEMDGRGIKFEATGVLNEPNDRPIRFADRQWPVVVKSLRSALDGRGLNTVAIVAPESANCGDDANRAVDAIKADPTAWAALSGVATHTYHNAATVEMADRAAGKDYWITEAGAIFDGEEFPGDDIQACSVAARFLNDVNHGATHWIYFIGYELEDPAGNSDRILVLRDDPFEVRVQQKYHYLRQLASAFDRQAVFRRATSSLDGPMTYKYGPKPRVQAAVARNPGGSWTIGLTDFTSDHLTGPTADPIYKSLNQDDLGGRPDESFVTTVDVPELADAGDLVFHARRSGRGRTDAADVPVLMHHGTVHVRLEPLGLVTLRSDPVPTHIK